MVLDLINYGGDGAIRECEERFQRLRVVVGDADGANEVASKEGFEGGPDTCWIVRGNEGEVDEKEVDVGDSELGEGADQLRSEPRSRA